MKNLLKALPRAQGLQGLWLPLLVLALWEFTSRQSAAYAYAFVPLLDIWHSLLGLLVSGELLTNLLATMRTAMVGLVIGGSLGLLVGGLMGVSRTVDKLIGPLYHAVRQVPLLGWIPLIGLWFGNGLLSKVLIVSLAAFYPMVLNTYEGVRNVEKRFIEVAQVLKFSRWQLFTRVQLPGALPSVITGVMHALAFSWISTVGSELLFGSGPGLGGLMQTAQAASKMDVVLVAVASIGVIGLIINVGFTRISRHLLRWRHAH